MIWSSVVCLRCISAGNSSETQQLMAAAAAPHLHSPPHSRPYRVSNWNRTLRKGIMAESLQDLLQKVTPSLWDGITLRGTLGDW